MKKILFLFILLFTLSASAQVVYHPVESGVYSFLSDLANRGIIDYDDQIVPLSREYIAKTLGSIESNSSKLTSVEKDELTFWKKEFGVELHLDNYYDSTRTLALFDYDQYGRFRQLSYTNPIMNINANLIAIAGIGKYNEENFRHTSTGLNFYGYFGNAVAFSFTFRDNSLITDEKNVSQRFSPKRAINLTMTSSNNYQFSDVKTSLSYGWSWGSITAANDVIEMGYGKSGKIILTSYAPSYPFIRLDIKPTSWLSFNYFHGWLNSNIADTTRLYNTQNPPSKRIVYRDKHLASHSVTVTPFTGLDLTLGESIIYSDKFELAYLFPLMFFRAADHQLSNGSNDAGDNSQFFFIASSRNHIPDTHLYFNLFIDEVGLSTFFIPEQQRHQFAFSIGGSNSGSLVDNLTLSAEFTKIYPWVYRHYIDTQTYQNDGFGLGHWMGHNSDLLYFSAEYTIMRGVEVFGNYMLARKGGDGEVKQQYTIPSVPHLFGARKFYSFATFGASYEPIHDVVVRANLSLAETRFEQDFGITLTNNRNDFEFYVSYGF